MAVVLLATGCKSLFPTEATHSKTKWRTFEEVQAAYDRIMPNETSHEELKALGFDPAHTPNIKVLTYLDLISRFMPNNSLTLQDLPDPVRHCITEREGCRAYELTLEITDRDRYGNLALDVFGFKKKTRITGWTYNALILTRDDVVVYKLRSGEPLISRTEKRVKPLGPLQELDGMVGKALGGMF